MLGSRWYLSYCFLLARKKIPPLHKYSEYEQVYHISYNNIKYITIAMNRKWKPKITERNIRDMKKVT